MRLLIILLALSGVPFATWHRVSTQPILAPQGDGFESAGVFNPAVIEKDGKLVMLYRAQDGSGTSRLGYASSDDGAHFTRRSAPVFYPETDYERGGGVEDPRLVKIGDTYYLTYTGYNKKDAQLCLATSTDLLNWKRNGVILPAYKGRWNTGWTKSGAILNEKIDGKYWMYFMADAKDHPGQMGAAYSTDLIHWTDALDHPVLYTRPGLFDSKVAEPGPPPKLTDRGILLIYNGADDRLVYRTGWVIFNRRDPVKVVARASDALFHPELEWEKSGQVANVVFVEGLVRQRNRLLIYYGAADKYIGVVEASQ